MRQVFEGILSYLKKRKSGKACKKVVGRALFEHALNAEDGAWLRKTIAIYSLSYRKSFGSTGVAQHQDPVKRAFRIKLPQIIADHIKTDVSIFVQLFVAGTPMPYFNSRNAAFIFITVFRRCIMYRWLTLTVALISSVIFVSGDLKPRKSFIIKLGICLAAEISVCFAFWLLKEEAFIFPLAAGQTASLAIDLLKDKKSNGLFTFCFYICFDSAYLPFFFCDENIWSYAVYVTVLVFCVVISPLRGKYFEIGFGEIYSGKGMRRRAAELLPGIILVPEALLIAALRSPDLISAGILNFVFLILLAIALWLRRETVLRMTLQELNNAMNRWQYESRDYMNVIRSQRHDFNLHLHALSGLLNGGEYEKSAEYVKNLVAEANDINDIMPVNDAVVGSMLCNMREEARKKGSDIVYSITYDMADILCNGFECNKIIGNLLKNAIDAIQTEEDRKFGIRLSIFKRRGNTVIVSENRFTGDPNRIARVFEPGFSTKKGHEGIGLSMVLRTAEIYGGRVYPEFEDDVIRFVVNIPNRVNLTGRNDGK